MAFLCLQRASTSMEAIWSIVEESMQSVSGWIVLKIHKNKNILEIVTRGGHCRLWRPLWREDCSATWLRYFSRRQQCLPDAGLPYILRPENLPNLGEKKLTSSIKLCEKLLILQASVGTKTVLSKFCVILNQKIRLLYAITNHFFTEIIVKFSILSQNADWFGQNFKFRAAKR